MPDEGDKTSSGAGERDAVKAATSAPPPPTEPFPCPNCGQMLAPTCRVCVACQEPVDFSRLHPKPMPPAPPAETIQRTLGRSQFSWRIFLFVLGLYFALALLAEKYLRPLDYRLVLAGVLVASSAWVFYDARSRHVPHPVRWGVSALLLWIVVFPWYLSRRRAPEAPCALMESQGSVFIRALVWIVLIFFVLSIIAAVIHKPPH